MLWKALHHLPEMELRLRTRHGPLRVSNKDRGVGRILFLHGEYEHGGIQKAVRLLRQVRSRWPPDGGLIIDAGANIGTVCISMVKNHLFSGALAIEPEPRKRKGIKIKSYDGSPGVREFERLNRAIDAMDIQVPIAAGFKLEEAADAHRFMEKGHILGKVVLRVSS